MHTLYFVRHGQKMPTAGEPELSALGNLQAQQTGKHFQQLPITRVIASPSLRTQQTARHICQAIQLSHETDELLRERANWGDDPQQTFEQFIQMWTEASNNRDQQPVVGDSSRDAGQRIEQVVSKLLTEEAPQHIVLVTHGGVIADFLRNIFSEDMLAALVEQFQYGKDYRIRECSITELYIEEKQPVLRRLASVEHLTNGDV
jgi:2,3-bisphosphoglycerate-dependent phosphoglycerate mutase